jgi:hypothetical protein
MNKMKLLHLAIAFILTGLLFAMLSIPKAAATGSPYVDPEDTSINLDLLFVVGGTTWLSGIVFYVVGNYFSQKYK